MRYYHVTANAKRLISAKKRDISPRIAHEEDSYHPKHSADTQHMDRQSATRRRRSERQVWPQHTKSLEAKRRSMDQIHPQVDTMTGSDHESPKTKRVEKMKREET